MSDTDPDIPIVDDDEETLRDRVDDLNDRNAWFRWSALAVGIAMLAGGAIEWCNQ